MDCLQGHGINQRNGDYWVVSISTSGNMQQNVLDCIIL